MSNNTVPPQHPSQPWGTPPPGWQAAPLGQHPIPPKKRKVWPWAAGAVGVLALVGIANGGGDDPSTTAATTSEASSPGFTWPADPTTTTVESPAGPKTTFGNGTYLVGSQLAPGTYQAPGGSNCYYERRSNTSADFDGIIANEWSTDSSQQIVTIDASDVAFKSKGCGTWKAVQ